MNFRNVRSYYVCRQRSLDFDIFPFIFVRCWKLIRFVFRDSLINGVKIFNLKHFTIFLLFCVLFFFIMRVFSFSAHSFQGRWLAGIFIQEWNKESTSTFLKVCLAPSCSLCLGVCSSLFRTRILPSSSFVGTVIYRSYVCNLLLLNAVTVMPCQPGTYLFPIFSVHTSQQNDVRRFAAICW